MVQFAESDYNRSMRSYETACATARIGAQASAEVAKTTEDSLVEGGLQAIEEYEALLVTRRDKASCLAEFDGVARGESIARRVRARLATQAGTP